MNIHAAINVSIAADPSMINIDVIESNDTAYTEMSFAIFDSENYD